MINKLKERKNLLFYLMFPLSFFNMDQKMDRNRDGVVTIDEFIETCQKVNPYANLKILPHDDWPNLCTILLV